MPVPDAEFDKLTAEAKAKAFTVAEVTELDLLTQVWEALDKAVADGTSFEDFKLSVGEQLESAWGGEGGYRLETVFRTNVQVALNAGRYAQQTNPAVLKRRPIWKFSAIFDRRTTVVCSLANGTTLRSDDPWWDSHQPPLHHNCRSTVIALTEEDAGDDLTEAPPEMPPSEGFGARPSLEWTPDLDKYPTPLRAAYEAARKKVANR